MKVTNILSSHYAGSFVQNLLDQFNQGLAAAGHQQSTLSLYDMDFDPVMRGEDFNQFFKKPAPDSITKIHKMLEETQLLTFFYPVWWNDMPAIMKGFIDRVFSKGFAYDYDENGQWGLLTIKKVILVCTFGNKQDPSRSHLEEAMRVKERDGVFGFCGVKEVEHLFLYNVEGSPAGKQAMLDQMRQMGETLTLGE